MNKRQNTAEALRAIIKIDAEIERLEEWRATMCRAMFQNPHDFYLQPFADLPHELDRVH